MKRVFPLILLSMALVTGCETKEPYPYSPQFAAPIDTPARLLPVPPQPGDRLYIMAINDILERQKHVDVKTLAAIRDEVPVIPEMVVHAVLGKDITREAFPKLYNLLDRSGSDAHRISDHAKNYWHTKRPWQLDARVKLLVDPIENPSYPSGHTLIGHVWAGVLSDAIACKRDALYARASVIAEHRITAGAHFFYDIDAGKQMAMLIMRRLRWSDAYAQALGAAKRETAGKFCAKA